MTEMSPVQPDCAGVVGVVGSAMLLLTWQVFWGVLEELVVVELLGVWLMARLR